jgi:serine/threonine-protein kinase
MASEHKTGSLPDGASLDDDELPPGTRVGAYVLGRLLARGGFSHVYEAAHTTLVQPAAIKILRRSLLGSSVIVERFLREARASGLARHPHVVEIYEIGRLPDGRPYQVMELLSGETLEAFVRRSGPLGAREAQNMLRSVCAAVTEAHRQRVVHRDLTASNVMVGPALAWVKLFDFGVAKFLREDYTTITSNGARVGTPPSMAPEQIRGEPVDERADIYALGVLLYFALVGEYPYRGKDPLRVMRMHLHDAAPIVAGPRPDAAAFDHIIARCMAKERDQRYGSVEELERAVASALDAPSREAVSP